MSLSDSIFGDDLWDWLNAQTHPITIDRDMMFNEYIIHRRIHGEEQFVGSGQTVEEAIRDAIRNETDY